MNDRVRELVPKWRERADVLDGSCSDDAYESGDSQGRTFAYRTCANELEAALAASQPSDLRAKLEALREPSEKATAGPWAWDEHHQILNESESLQSPTCSVLSWNRKRNFEGVEYTYILARPEDKAFIVACVNTIRAILEGK